MFLLALIHIQVIPIHILTYHIQVDMAQAT